MTRLTQTGWGGRPYAGGAFAGKEALTGAVTRLMQMCIGGSRYGEAAFAGKETSDVIVTIPNRYYRRSLRGVKLHYPMKWNTRL